MFKNKPNIVITGGTRGLGFYTAKYLSKLGWNLIIIDISPGACAVYKESKNLKEVQSKLSNNNSVNISRLVSQPRSGHCGGSCP